MKSKQEILESRSILDVRGGPSGGIYLEAETASLAADPVVANANRSQLEKMVDEAEKKMKRASKDLDFITAAQHRDEMLALKKQLKERFTE